MVFLIKTALHLSIRKRCACPAVGAHEVVSFFSLPDMESALGNCNAFSNYDETRFTESVADPKITAKTALLHHQVTSASFHNIVPRLIEYGYSAEEVHDVVDACLAEVSLCLQESSFNLSSAALSFSVSILS